MIVGMFKDPFRVNVLHQMGATATTVKRVENDSPSTLQFKPKPSLEEADTHLETEFKEMASVIEDLGLFVGTQYEGMTCEEFIHSLKPHNIDDEFLNKVANFVKSDAHAYDRRLVLKLLNSLVDLGVDRNLIDMALSDDEAKLVWAVKDEAESALSVLTATVGEEVMKELNRASHKAA